MAKAMYHVKKMDYGVKDIADKSVYVFFSVLTSESNNGQMPFTVDVRVVEPPT